MSRDLHKEPFDEGTKEKLWIFEQYVKAWLPTFLSPNNRIFSRINVCDFFAGPGKDMNGIEGSPLLLLKHLPVYYDIIKRNKQSLSVYFNDADKNKIQALEATIESMNVPRDLVTITTSSSAFETSFKCVYPSLNQPNTANFLFLDQNGIKEITKEIFEQIVLLKNTDFIFFISSSALHRFKSHPNITKHIPTEKVNDASSQYCHIHRNVLRHYKNLLPAGIKYYLAPFSIKKKSNIYGLIFGTHHLRGVEKFLTQCWNADPERGEANFDIDNDNLIEGQSNLFEEYEKPKKTVGFQRDLRSKILSREITTNRQVFRFALENGFLAKHAREVIAAMKKEKIIKNSFGVSTDAWKSPDVEILL
jgi:three-Cys-motif partner protein